MRYAFFGGTFDPLHLGHLNIAQRVIDNKIVDKVIFVPVFKAPHKENDKITSFKIRLEMLNKVLSKNKDFLLEDIESKLEGPSYSFKTLEYLKKEYGEMFLIIGTDQLKEFHTWYNYQQIMNDYKLIVFNREELSKEYYKHKNILKIEQKIIPFSSTDIRDRIKNKKGIRYMVPEEIYWYILKNDLYIS